MVGFHTGRNDDHWALLVVDQSHGWCARGTSSEESEVADLVRACLGSRSAAVLFTDRLGMVERYHHGYIQAIRKSHCVLNGLLSGRGSSPQELSVTSSHKTPFLNAGCSYYGNLWELNAVAGLGTIRDILGNSFVESSP